MSRTAEETARLAASVTVKTIYGDVGISAEVAMGAASARFHGSDHPRLHALACLAADLAEARAEVAALRAGASRAADLLKMGIAAHETEVATLRGHVKLMRDWQAAKREYEAARVEDERLFDLCQRSERNRHAYGPLFSTARTRRGTAHLALLSVEARLLAADLGEEVGRG